MFGRVDEHDGSTYANGGGGDQNEDVWKMIVRYWELAKKSLTDTIWRFRTLKNKAETTWTQRRWKHCNKG